MYPSLDELTQRRISNLKLQISLNAKRSDKVASIYDYEQRIKQQVNATVTGEIPTYESLYVTQQSEEQKQYEKSVNLINLLRQIADPENAEAIYRKLNAELTDAEMQTVQEQWTGILKQIKKTFTKGVSVTAIVNFIVDYLKNQKVLQPAVENNVFITKPQPETPNKRGAKKRYRKEREREQIKTEAVDKEIQSPPTKILKDNVNTPPTASSSSSSSSSLSKKKKANSSLGPSKPITEYFGNDNSRSGVGLKRKTKIRFVMRGTGASGEVEESVRIQRGFTRDEYKPLNKFIINYDKLYNENLIVLKYASNLNICEKFRKTKVSNAVRDILLQIIDGQFSKATYSNLSADDKNLVRGFCDSAHVNIHEYSIDNFQKNYDILIGEFNSGNKNPRIKKQIIGLISQGIAEKRIKTKDGLEIISSICS